MSCEPITADQARAISIDGLGDVFEMIRDCAKEGKRILFVYRKLSGLHKERLRGLGYKVQPVTLSKNEDEFTEISW